MCFMPQLLPVQALCRNKEVHPEEGRSSFSPCYCNSHLDISINSMQRKFIAFKAQSQKPLQRKAPKILLSKITCSCQIPFQKYKISDTVQVIRKYCLRSESTYMVINKDLRNNSSLGMCSLNILPKSLLFHCQQIH